MSLSLERLNRINCNICLRGLFVVFQFVFLKKNIFAIALNGIFDKTFEKCS